MKKMIAFVLAALMVLSLAACGSNSGKKNDTPKTEPSSKTDVIKTDVTPEAIEQAIAKALGEGYLPTVNVPKEELFSSAIGRLDLEKIESYVAKQAAVASVNLDCVAIAKCKTGYADEAVKLFNEYYAQMISYIRQYPFGVAKVEGARLYKVGDTVIFVIAGADVGENASAEDEAKLAAAEYAKVDEAIKSVCGAVPENLAVITEPTQNDNGGGEFFDGGDGGVIGG